MRQIITEDHRMVGPNPAGGTTSGTGFQINWQNGPLKNEDGTFNPPSGAFVEGILQAARGRLLFYQSSKFKCEENEAAIDYIDQALEAMDSRTTKRKSLNIEGTHKLESEAIPEPVTAVEGETSEEPKAD